MRRHHISRREGRAHRAALASVLLTLLLGRRRHHRWHQSHPGRQQLVRGSFGPSRYRARHGRWRGWSR
jgi:hypothetical protein